MLGYLLPRIESGISSEAPDAFGDTSPTHIIVIYGFKMPSYDALHSDIGGLGNRGGAIAYIYTTAFGKLHSSIDDTFLIT